ncbi:MAG: HAD family hydrolase [Hyphomicrobiaceae bacterium]
MDGWTCVFDLDGTLIDTAPDLIRATNHVLALQGLAAVGKEALRPVISFGSRRMIETGLAVHGVDLPDADVTRLWQAFLAFYASNIAVESRPFPGMPEALTELATQGARLAVCTNKREALARQLLDELGLAERFTVITGVDTFPVCKPHPDHLLGCISRAGGHRERALMVGDSDTDVQTAISAGVPVVGVTFGYTEIPMRDLPADAIIEHYRDLVPALMRLRDGPGAAGARGSG